MDQQKHISKLQKRVKKHFADFVAMPYAMDSFRDEPCKYYEQYLAGDDDCAFVATRTNELCTWHLSNYLNGVLSSANHSFDDLGLAARFACANTEFAHAFANAGKRGKLILWESVLFLSLNVLVGWKTESASIGRAIVQGLDTTLLGLRHTPEHEAGSLYRHFWFLVQLYCDANKMPLDTSLYSYPEDMSPYAAVLADWRTTDLAKVHDFVNSMADFHLQHARFAAHDEVDEFDVEETMLFPHEILSFLRLREWAGLGNPSQFAHPLMKHPMARMPGPVPLPKPSTPLLDAVIAKFQKEFPGSFQD